MSVFEQALLRLILGLLEQWPELRQEVSTCTSSEEAGRRVAAFLQKPAIPAKHALLEQTLALALAQIKPALLGTEVGIAYRQLFDPFQGDEEARNDWRGNATCALLVRLLAETHEPHGGLAWSDDLDRRGFPTVADWRKIELLEAGKEYDLASLKNTTLEQVANFCDLIQDHECPSPMRPHRALAGLLFPRLGRIRTHAVLFRIAQAGLLDHLAPDPLGDNETLAYRARICDARASQSLGFPSSWHRFFISHLALAALLVEVVGVELADVCLTALDACGTLTALEPGQVGLPNGGEEEEWQWTCERAGELEVIQHPLGSWGIRRRDGKILMRLHPPMSALVFATPSAAEAQRLLLEPLTAEQRQERGFF